MLSGGSSRPKAKTDRFFDLVKLLVDAKAPTHGIGEQAHFTNQAHGIDAMLAKLDRFATLGLPITITKFDFATADDRLHADFIHDFYTAAFSHPSIDGIFAWGFWEGAHWKPAAALWRRDWSDRPAVEAYRRLVYGVSTQATVKTDQAGRARTRGFLGVYEFTARLGDRSGKTEVRLTKNGLDATITVR